MTHRLYRDDAYLLDFDAHVIDSLEYQGHPAVILDRTAFYPESGGQPWDKGVLSGVEVLSVVEDSGKLLHVLASPLEARSVHGAIDPERRRDHREQHHGQHLLSRALREIASAETVSVHLGDETNSIDLDREVSPEVVRAAFGKTNDIVLEARPVTTRCVSRAEALSLGLRPAEEAGDSVRLVEATGFDLQPCGGTHPRNTAEVGLVLSLGQERYKGGSRIRFVCGHRAMRMATSRIELLDRLGGLLSSPPEGIVDAVERLKTQLGALNRRTRELREKALKWEALELLREARGSLIVARRDGWSPDDLRALANEIVTHGDVVALLGAADSKAHLVFARSSGLPHDMAVLLREAAATLGGRGGGSPSCAQGGGERIQDLDAALAAAAQKIRGES